MTSTISRRQILSRSRDAGLDHLNNFPPYEQFEDMWFSVDQLFKDNVSEVLKKWDHIDDEIWGKLIFMSRNRRVAKAYVRLPAVIVDGSDEGFDGHRVGINGFDDPFRDAQTDKLMRFIDKGCSIGMANNGNVIVKRYSQSEVFVKSYRPDFADSCIATEVIKSGGRLPVGQATVIFDMTKFEAAMAKELKSAYPDRRRLERQCIVTIGFVRDTVTEAKGSTILDLPIYVMLINIVALDLLKSRLYPVVYKAIGNGNNNNNTQAKTNSSTQQRLPNKRVPEFVNIFGKQQQQQQQHQQHKHRNNNNDYDLEEEEDELYGAINDGVGVSDDYFTPEECAKEDFRRTRPYHALKTMGTGGSSKYTGSSGGESSNSSTTYHHLHHHPFPGAGGILGGHPKAEASKGNRGYGARHPFDDDDDDDDLDAGIDNDLESDYVSGGQKPPRLPPRDKKKLSKQINAVKSNRTSKSNERRSRYHQREEDPYSVEIPAPDYLDDEPGEGPPPPPVSSAKRNSSKSRPPSSSTTATVNGKTSIEKENGHSQAPPPPPPQGHYRQHRQASSSNNYPNHRKSENIYDHLHTTTTNNNNTNTSNRMHSHWSNGSNAPRGGANKKLSSTSLPHMQLPKTYRDSAFLDEDPYYSGLEARITSKRHDPNHKSRGLGQMVRKVLSTNYINLLSLKRPKKSSPSPPLPLGGGGKGKSKGSKSGGDYSTSDSDPYMSINEVYEPIYGYAGPKRPSPRRPMEPMWSQTTDDHHRQQHRKGKKYR